MHEPVKPRSEETPQEAAEARRAPAARTTITQRMAAMVVVLVAVTGTLLGFALFDVSASAIVAQEEDDLARTMPLFGERFSGRIAKLRRDVLFLSQLRAVRGVVETHDGQLDTTRGEYEGWRAALRDLLAKFVTANEDYMQVRLIGSADNGGELVRVDRVDGRVVAVAEDELQAKGDRPYFRDTIGLPSGAVYLSRIELNQEHGTIVEPHQPTVRVATPIHDRAGAPFGVVIINVEATAWLDDLAREDRKGRRFYLANSDGEFLFHPDSSRTFGWEFGVRHRIQDEFPQTAVLFETDAARVAAADEQSIIHAERLNIDPDNPARRLILMAATPKELVLARATTIGRWTLVITLAMTSLAIIVAVLLARYISRPLVRLTAAVRQIELGEARPDLSLSGGGREVEQLAAAFRQMTDDLFKTAVSRDELIEEVRDRQQAEAQLQAATEALSDKAAELESINRELEAFSYSVSHDLRGPLRSIDGFSLALIEDFGDKLGKEGRSMLDRVRQATIKMGGLIDDLLNLSRVSRAPLKAVKTDLSELVQAIIDRLREQEPERVVEIDVAPQVSATCDPHLINIVLTNLVENAWKFTAKADQARIAFGTRNPDGKHEYFISDNGAGFDMEFAGKLFQPFQRLHAQTEFPGTGIGLATVARIIRRHGGHVSARSEPGKKTIFVFTLKPARTRREKAQ